MTIVPKPDEGAVRFGGRQTLPAYQFELTGGRLCLDLANTKEGRPGEHPRELLREYQDALDWGVQAGALSRLEGRRLHVQAAGHPHQAAEALRRLVDGREVIFEVFSAVARRRVIPPVPLGTVNALIADAFGKRELVARPRRLDWAWRPTDAPDMDRPLWSAVWSAMELLTSDALGRVRQCAGVGCAWLFMDTSKNGTRRWCDMSVCGNRAKARRHRSRVRTAGLP